MLRCGYSNTYLYCCREGSTSLCAEKLLKRRQLQKLNCGIRKEAYVMKIQGPKTRVLKVQVLIERGVLRVLMPMRQPLRARTGGTIAVNRAYTAELLVSSARPCQCSSSDPYPSLNEIVRGRSPMEHCWISDVGILVSAVFE